MGIVVLSLSHPNPFAHAFRAVLDTGTGEVHGGWRLPDAAAAWVLRALQAALSLALGMARATGIEGHRARRNVQITRPYTDGAMGHARCAVKCPVACFCHESDHLGLQMPLASQLTFGSACQQRLKGGGSWNWPRAKVADH